MGEKIAKFEQDYYDQFYFLADENKGKSFRRSDGSIGFWGYHAKQRWTGWTGIIEPFKLLFKPRMVLDVGCGCGSFIEMARACRVKAVGIDFSEYAIKNALEGAKKWVSVGDARDIHFPDDSFDFVLATDLLEHIYLEDVDRVIDELCRVSSKWIFLQIATVGMKDKPTEGYVLRKGEPIPLEIEVYTVAGHVLVQKPEWWEERLKRPGWRLRPDIVDKFRRLVKPPELIANWRTIFVVEKWP